MAKRIDNRQKMHVVPKSKKERILLNKLKARLKSERRKWSQRQK